MTLRAARILKVTRRGTVEFFRRDGLVYSAAVAFNLLLSSIPVLFLAFAGMTLVIGKDDLPFAQLSKVLGHALPFGSEVIVPNLRRLFARGHAIGIAGSVLLLASSFSATGAVHTSLAVMLGRPRKRQIWRSAAFHVALILVLIVLAAAALVVPPLWKGILLLSREMPIRIDTAFHFLPRLWSAAALTTVLFAGSALSYRYLSPKTLRWSSAFSGGLVFAALAQAIKYGFVFYITKFGKLSLIYGSLFGIVSFIIVAYLFAAAYLYCASIIGALEDGR